MYSIFAQLLQKRGVTAYQVSKATGVSQSSLSDWKNGKSKPKYDKLKKIADYFNVSVDIFLEDKQETKKEPTLSEKDERDVLRKLEETLDSLGNAKDGLMFDGEPLDPETWELLRDSIYQDLKMAKLAAKKYTPKKYRKE